MVLLDTAILMNPQVWVASGHVGGFSDPLIDDKKTKERFRADKLLEGLIEDTQQVFLRNSPFQEIDTNGNIAFTE